MNKRKVYLERIIITGPRSEGQTALEWAYQNGYHIVWSGPMPKAGHMVDPTRFKYVGEREIQRPETVVLVWETPAEYEKRIAGERQ